MYSFEIIGCASHCVLKTSATTWHSLLFSKTEIFTKGGPGKISFSLADLNHRERELVRNREVWRGGGVGGKLQSFSAVMFDFRHSRAQLFTSVFLVANEY
jgi:hypothetical protein